MEEEEEWARGKPVHTSLLAGAVVVLTPSPDDGGAASLALLRALIDSSPETREQASQLGCQVSAASGGLGQQQRADIRWREGAQPRGTLTLYPHLAAISKVWPPAPLCATSGEATIPVHLHRISCLHPPACVRNIALCPRCFLICIPYHF